MIGCCGGGVNDLRNWTGGAPRSEARRTAGFLRRTSGGSDPRFGAISLASRPIMWILIGRIAEHDGLLRPAL